jgi:hypothetical protein
MHDYIAPWFAAIAIALAWIAYALIDFRIRDLERKQDAAEARELLAAQLATVHTSREH